MEEFHPPEHLDEEEKEHYLRIEDALHNLIQEIVAVPEEKRMHFVMTVMMTIAEMFTGNILETMGLFEELKQSVREYHHFREEDGELIEDEGQEHC